MELGNVVKGEGKAELKIEDGKVKVIASYDGKQADAQLVISFGIEEYAELLKKAIPGELDDAIINMLVGAMKN